MINKIIFLDIDGVLNSVKSAIYYNRTNADKECHPYRDFDLYCVVLLSEILKEHPSCKLVISSTWRLRYEDDPEDLKKIFESIPHKEVKEIIQSRIIGRTPNIVKNIKKGLKTSREQVFRGVEIQEWIDRNEDRLDPECKFIILDDDSDMSYLRFYHVQTDGREGLLFKDYEKVVHSLKTRKELKLYEAQEAISRLYRGSWGFECHEKVSELIEEAKTLLKEELYNEQNSK